MNRSGFFASLVVFYLTNLLFPVQGRGEMDKVDFYGTFTEDEARKIGCAPAGTRDEFAKSKSLDSDEKADLNTKLN